MNIRKFFAILLVTAFALPAGAQEKIDTVKIPLAKTSQIIFTMKDRSDLETLKHYNFQDLFHDILMKLENSDTTATVPGSTIDTTVVVENNDNTERWSNNDESDEDEDDEDWEWHGERRRWGRTWQSFNFDLGTNNYLQDGSFPDKNNAAYAVRPWGSWYIAFNSIQRSRLGRNFFLEWGAGISWYTFKFQNANTVIERDDSGITFSSDTARAYNKSKLGITFINASLVPVIDFGDHSRKPRIWNGHRSAFRIGLGPYIGYRISSLSKVVFEQDGDREKEKDRGNFYLNNLRYGVRLQLGFHSTDFFFNYDMNELFATGKGPKLNAFSFGVIF